MNVYVLIFIKSIGLELVATWEPFNYTETLVTVKELHGPPL